MKYVLYQGLDENFFCLLKKDLYCLRSLFIDFFLIKVVVVGNFFSYKIVVIYVIYRDFKMIEWRNIYIVFCLGLVKCILYILGFFFFLKSYSYI